MTTLLSLAYEIHGTIVFAARPFVAWSSLCDTFWALVCNTDPGVSCGLSVLCVTCGPCGLLGTDMPLLIKLRICVALGYLADPYVTLLVPSSTKREHLDAVLQSTDNVLTSCEPLVFLLW